MGVPLSVVIIAKNEASRIRECLESVYGWAGEIILADDQSSDQTKDIAREYTDKILSKKMAVEGSYRNWAYSQSTFDWVLSLDADERITPELQEEIASVLNSNLEAAAFTIPRKNFLGNYWLKWGGQYPSAQLKLFRHNQFRWEEVEVHPRAFLEGVCLHLRNPLVHYTYRNFEDFLAKLNRQTTLEAKKWIAVYRENPRKANYKMNLFHAVWRYEDRFLRSYVRKQGWRDGFIGFMVSFLSALYQLISYAKYWEMKKKISLPKVN